MAQLGQVVRAPRQSLGKIWRGNALNVSVAMLERLASRLGRPGAWFRWENDRLVWNVKAVAEQVGLDRSMFAFRSLLFPQAADIFWYGTAEFAFVKTLAKIAAALETEATPFDVGELFIK